MPHQSNSHTNMVVIGDQDMVIQTSLHTADVWPFSNKYSKMEQLPIVKVVFTYDCPHTGKLDMLVMQNALHIKSMGHSLILSFIMEEAGLTINNVFRIYCGNDVSEKTHSVISKEHSL